MNFFEEYIQQTDVLTESDKIIVLQGNISEDEQKKIIEVIETYKADKKFQKHILESLEFSALKSSILVFKEQLDGEQQNILGKDLENTLNFI